MQHASLFSLATHDVEKKESCQTIVMHWKANKFHTKIDLAMRIRSCWKTQELILRTASLTTLP